MNEKMNILKNLWQEIARLQQISAVLHWDEATHLPEKASLARAEQSAVLQGLIHNKITSPEMGRVLESLQADEGNWPDDSLDKRFLQIVRKTYERSTCLPNDFQKKFTKQVSETYQTWIQARAKNDFKKVQPCLEKMLALTLEKTQHYKGYDHPLDSLIDDADEGFTVVKVEKLFSELREKLVPIVQKIGEAQKLDDSCLHQPYPIALQKEFGEKIIQKLGYDFSRGRLDKTHHPFCTSFSVDDVRITTRYRDNYLPDSLFSTIHEAGHALYEQGVNPDYEATPLASGTSMSVHESQSRLWENFVGRSYEFWQYFYPKLQKTFPDALQNVSLTTFYKAINCVERSFIRVDADEVTYNLHVMIRFALEKELLTGRLAIKDLRDAWNAAYEKDLGITPKDDKTGVLQDVHWYGGILGGYFQSYTLGNLMSAQFFQAAQKAHPEISHQMQSGEFANLHTYLQKNIYCHGKRFPTLDLIQNVTGATIHVDPFVSYLKTKYQKIYEVDL